MEVEEIQTQAYKLSRIGNARNDSSKIGLKGGELYQDEDEEEGEEKGSGGGGVGGGSEGSRLRAWYSSRIHRVSRQTGGKDRHSKVLTAKGLRDRRVRLSVSTAIQFYDLQDRLGYDQPSKAVEWLIKAAADAIAELPSLESKFPGTPKQPSDEKRPNASEPGFDAAEMELDADHSYQQQQQQHHSLTKSACSSTSETSKGSVLSLSRSEIRVKARERAREKTAAKDKEKEKQKDEPQLTPQQSSHNSFTELLTGGANSHSPTAAPQQNHFFLKTTRHLPSTSMDYINPGLFGQSSSRPHFSTGFPSQTLFGIAPLPHTMPMQQQPFSVPGDHHPELQHFSFIPDQLISDAAAVTGSDYNLNFSISSGLAGYNRGTLQSNSPSPMPHLQRFSTDGPNMSFFIGNVGASAAPPAENQFPAGFDGRLQLCYGDGGRHSDLKGKGKS